MACRVNKATACGPLIIEGGNEVGTSEQRDEEVHVRTFWLNAWRVSLEQLSPLQRGLWFSLPLTATRLRNNNA